MLVFTWTVESLFLQKKKVVVFNCESLAQTAPMPSKSLNCVFSVTGTSEAPRVCRLCVGVYVKTVPALLTVAWVSVAAAHALGVPVIDALSVAQPLSRLSCENERAYDSHWGGQTTSARLSHEISRLNERLCRSPTSARAMMCSSVCNLAQQSLMAAQVLLAFNKSYCGNDEYHPTTSWLALRAYTVAPVGILVSLLSFVQNLFMINLLVRHMDTIDQQLAQDTRATRLRAELLYIAVYSTLDALFAVIYCTEFPMDILFEYYQIWDAYYALQYYWMTPTNTLARVCKRTSTNECKPTSDSYYFHVICSGGDEHREVLHWVANCQLHLQTALYCTCRLLCDGDSYLGEKLRQLCPHFNNALRFLSLSRCPRHGCRVRKCIRTKSTSTIFPGRSRAPITISLWGKSSDSPLVFWRLLLHCSFYTVSCGWKAVAQCDAHWQHSSTWNSPVRSL